MLPLPLSLQSFSGLRKLGCLYVDKTKFAYDLISKQQSFFLARPRRFGKTIFISTLKEILLGNKELFTGLFIEKTTYAWPVYGVIHLDFGNISSKQSAIVEEELCQMLWRVASQYEVSLSIQVPSPTSSSILIALVDALYKKYDQVAILIDEYDHPILKVLQDPQEEEVRSVLQGFFTTVKSLYDRVSFLFITGVSMFSKAGIFSGMNNPINLSLDPKFAGICGYTDEEIDLYFKEHIAAWAEKGKTSPEQIREDLRTWYNGYHFSEESLSVYNPFSILNALNLQKFRNFWFESGSPSFLIKELQKAHRKQECGAFDLSHFKVSSNLLGAVDVDQIPLSTLLFQTGYLTLAKYDEVAQNYWLDYPNHEVKTALNQQLLLLASNITPESADYLSRELSIFLNQGNIEEAVSCLKTLFSSVPYQIHIAEESFYHSLLQIAFAASGIKSTSEYSTSHSRIDMVLHLPSRIYVCEVKFNKTAKAALAQIEKRRYYESFLSSGKPVTLLGLCFTKKPSDFLITYVKKDIPLK